MTQPAFFFISDIYMHRSHAVVVGASSDYFGIFKLRPDLQSQSGQLDPICEVFFFFFFLVSI